MRRGKTTQLSGRIRLPGPCQWARVMDMLVPNASSIPSPLPGLTSDPPLRSSPIPSSPGRARHAGRSLAGPISSSRAPHARKFSPVSTRLGNAARPALAKRKTGLRLGRRVEARIHCRKGEASPRGGPASPRSSSAACRRHAIGSDPTIILWPDQGRAARPSPPSELVPNPYSTYQIAGLPRHRSIRPRSIAAVLNPLDSQELLRRQRDRRPCSPRPLPSTEERRPMAQINSNKPLSCPGALNFPPSNSSLYRRSISIPKGRACLSTA
jgi:hypothetical protein